VSSAPVTTASRIPARERLIVALDVPDTAAARHLVETLGDEVAFYKIGLELAATDGYFPLLEWLVEHGKRVFADLKLYDIPATVAAAVRQIGHSGASFLTVHGERSVVEAAAEAKGPELKVLAVTVLTSMGPEDLAASGITLSVAELVDLRARTAVAAGADGVVASGLEARELRRVLGAGPLIVTPGIRPEHDRGRDDQRRVVTARGALEAGADYIVVGRPVRGAPDPRRAASQMQAEIAACVE
jgi:orotidine-5'-phosphate decarboxylase